MKCKDPTLTFATFSRHWKGSAQNIFCPSIPDDLVIDLTCSRKEGLLGSHLITLFIQTDAMKRVEEILGCSSHEARRLLMHMRWSPEALFGTYIPSRSLRYRGPYKLDYCALETQRRGSHCFQWHNFTVSKCLESEIESSLSIRSSRSCGAKTQECSPAVLIHRSLSSWTFSFACMT